MAIAAPASSSSGVDGPTSETVSVNGPMVTSRRASVTVALHVEGHGERHEPHQRHGGHDQDHHEAVQAGRGLRQAAGAAIPVGAAVPGPV